MNPVKSKFFFLLLITAVFFLPGAIRAAQEITPDTQPPDVEEEEQFPVPSIADLTPLVSEMSGRKATLEQEMPDTSNLRAGEKSFSKIVDYIEKSAVGLQELKTKKEFRHRQFLRIKRNIRSERNALSGAIAPITEAIRTLEVARKEWLEEKKRWAKWESALLDEEPVLEEVQSILETAHVTIDAALQLITERLKPMLSAQKEAGNLQIRIDTLTAEIDTMVKVWEGSDLIEKTPPMYTSNYTSQLGSDLQSSLEKGLVEVQGPSARFLEHQGWVFSLQLLAALILAILLLRKRAWLKESEHLRILARRPVSAGLFFGFGTLAVLYSSQPAVWRLWQVTVFCFSFARLIGAIIKESWKKRFIYGFLILAITFQLVDVLRLPLSFVRLYILITALTTLIVGAWWAGRTRRRNYPLYITLGFYCGSLLLAVVVISEIWGQAEMAEYLFVPFIRIGLLLVVAWLMMYLATGGLELALKGSAFQRIKFVQGNTDTLLQQLTLLTNVLIGVLISSFLLTNLRMYETPIDAINGMISLGFTFGTQRITVGLLIFALVVIVGAYFISWIVQKVLIGGVLNRRHVSRGVQLAIARLFHYAIVSVGFLLAILMLGFELTQFVIIISALGIGIGFGLQSFVNNFICGLILLFERPVRVGDNIDLGGQWAEIKRIGLRSTTVETFDLANVIIPNNDLINNQVTNWTLANRFIRLIIPVGVAYGSDVTRVFETLMQCAKENPNVRENPEPQVLFRKFGESSLDFELRVWVSDVDNRLPLASDLHREIDQKFREAGIVIAFPQRDVHLDGTKPVESRVISEELPKDKK